MERTSGRSLSSWARARARSTGPVAKSRMAMNMMSPGSVLRWIVRPASPAARESRLRPTDPCTRPSDMPTVAAATDAKMDRQNIPSVGELTATITTIGRAIRPLLGGCAASRRKDAWRAADPDASSATVTWCYPRCT